MQRPAIHRPGHPTGRLPAAATPWIVPGRIGRIALLAAMVCGLAAVAEAQVASGGDEAGTAATAGGAAPAPASDATPGSLRAQIESVLPGTNQPLAGPTTAPAWAVIPGITLQEEWTDNALNTATDRRSSLITVVQPSISVDGSTARLTADLYYAPSAEIYTPEAQQNQFNQNLGANGLLTVVPDRFYIKASGYASVQSLSGGIASPGTTALSKANQAQTYNFSIEPYLTQRFGSWGTLQAGVSANQTTENQVSSGTTIQSLTERQVFAVFKSGENFGRLSSTVSFSATQDTGTGALQGASQTVASYKAGYALTHYLIALASIGWENIRYTGPGAPHYDDATWSAGAELIPNPDSSITVTYGHQNGATAASVDASYALGATVRLFAQYQAGVSTAAQTLSDVLTNANFDASGHPVNSVTGAPLLPSDNFFGFNGAVYQSRNLSVTLSWLRPRDGFQVMFSQQTQTPVGNSGATGAGTVVEAVTVGGQTIEVPLNLLQGVAATRGTYGTLSWEHDLSPVTSTNMSFQYGVLHNATPLIFSNGPLSATTQQVQDQQLVAFTAGLNWQINETLTSSVQYSYTNNDYSNGLPGMSANLVVLTLRKTF